MPNPNVVAKQIKEFRAKKKAASTKAEAKKLAKAKPASDRGESFRKTTEARITDAHRLNNFVISVLDEWRVAKEKNLAGSDQNIIKVSMREITLIMSRTLKNTRVSRLHDLINDTLSGLDIADVYGSWVFVDFDSPDCLFIRLPETSTNVLRVRAGGAKADAGYSLRKSTEQLIEDRFNVETEEDGDDEETPDYENWSDDKLRAAVKRQGLNVYGRNAAAAAVIDISNHDRDALIRMLVESKGC